MRQSRAAALWVLGWLLLCPLASAGFFGGCHEAEAAMDCCQPQEQGGSAAGAAAQAWKAPCPLPALAAAPLPGPLSSEHAEAPPAAPTGRRLQALLSTFLI